MFLLSETGFEYWMASKTDEDWYSNDGKSYLFIISTIAACTMYSAFAHIGCLTIYLSPYTIYIYLVLKVLAESTALCLSLLTIC